MVLSSVRLWYEGKSKDLEDILREAEHFHLSGYARCSFASSQTYVILDGGVTREVIEISANNRPVSKSLRDIWGKSKIKEGILQVFEVPPDIFHLLKSITARERILENATRLRQLEKPLLAARSQSTPVLLDIQAPEGKGLLVVDKKKIEHCFFTENEGFTLQGFEAFKRLAAVIAKAGTYHLNLSRLGAPEAAANDWPPWVAMLLEGVEGTCQLVFLKNRLVEKYGRHYAPGTILFHEGDEGHDFYLIVNGRIAIYKEKERRRKVLAELGAGDFFGEMAIVNQAKRSATAETRENSLLIKIDPDDLEVLLYNSYEFRINMVKKLCKRLRDTMDEMVRLWEDPRSLYLEKVIFQIINADEKWLEEGIPPGLLMQEISAHSGMRFSEIDAIFRRLLDTGKLDFIQGKVIIKEPSMIP